MCTMSILGYMCTVNVHGEYYVNIRVHVHSRYHVNYEGTCGQ